MKQDLRNRSVKGLVSIGMPVYNDKPFLEEAITSLLSQTYENFELIISDDCSTDGSAEICKKYADLDERISYVQQKINLGISRNMEFLLSEARGEFFMWAANDDRWDSSFIETLTDALNHNVNAVSAFCPMVFISESGKELDEPAGRFTDYSGITPQERIRKLIYKFDDCFGYGLFRRSDILDVKFPVWWGVNRSCPYNNIYPTLCYYLTKGDFEGAGESPLWFNRLKDEKNINHKIPYDHTLVRGFLAYLLRKVNLVIVSLENIYKASESISLIGRIAPYMLYQWVFMHSYSELKSRVRRWRKGDIKLI